MQLDRLALHLRRRGSWEAIDLGCAMARTWWRPAMAAWLALYVPVVIVVCALIRKPAIAILVVWWLKPLFDRTVLEVLSRAVFGDVPRVMDVLRSLRRSPGLLPSLTFYRFDLARSFNLPVWHLERLTGAAARARGQSLQRRTRGHAVWATIVFVHFEFVVIFAMLGAVDLFTPATYERALGLQIFFSGAAPVWREWLELALYAATVSLIEPFYVAAGFGLYLNRRTQLEAWDVELALRRFARRETPAAAAVAAAFVVALCLTAAAPISGHAAESEARPAHSAIREILATPEFERFRDETQFRLRKSDPQDAGAPPSLRWIAEIARAFMWIAVAVLVFAALYLARRYSGTWSLERKARGPPPDTLFGLDIAPQSLPPDVPAAALAAAEAGRPREALSLLYRGALSSLVNDGGLEVAPGDTEGDCVRHVRASEAPDKAQFFAGLVSEWERAAYAGRAPDVERVRALCRDWLLHFARGRRE